jgi:hypothetical protein
MPSKYKAVPAKDFNKACCGKNILLLEKWHSENRFPVNALDIINGQWKHIKNNVDVYRFLISIYPSLPIHNWFSLLETDKYHDSIVQMIENKIVILSNSNPDLPDMYDMFRSCRVASPMNRAFIIKIIGYENRTELLFETTKWTNFVPDRGRLLYCNNMIELIETTLKEGADINRSFYGKSLYESSPPDRSEILMEYGCEIDGKRLMDQAVFYILEDYAFGLIGESEEIKNRTYKPIKIDFSNKQTFFIACPDEKEIKNFIHNNIGFKIFDSIENFIANNKDISKDVLDELHETNSNTRVLVFEYKFDECNEKSPYYESYEMDIINNTLYYAFDIRYNQSILDAIQRCEKYGG